MSVVAERDGVPHVHTGFGPVQQEANRAARRTVSLPEAAAQLGVGRSLAYELVRSGKFPVPIIKLGRKIVVSQQALDQLLAGVAA